MKGLENQQDQNYGGQSSPLSREIHHALKNGGGQIFNFAFPLAVS